METIFANSRAFGGKREKVGVLARRLRLRGHGAEFKAIANALPWQGRDGRLEAVLGGVIAVRDALENGDAMVDKTADLPCGDADNRSFSRFGDCRTDDKNQPDGTGQPPADER